MKSSQSGNILFLILIAVALFAALSFAVTKSTRSGSSSTDREQQKLLISELFQYSSGLVTAIIRMEATGVNETRFCFFTGSNDASYNFSGCTDNEHRVFHPEGGGISYREPMEGLNDGTDWEFSGRPRVFGQGVITDRDLILVLRGMNQNICLQINESIGINNIPTDSGNLDYDPFDGSYTTGGTDSVNGCDPDCALNDIASSPFGAIAAHYGCFEEGDTNDLIYFYTLKAR